MKHVIKCLNWKLLFICLLVLGYVTNTISASAEEDTGLRCCKKPATHTTGGKNPQCCNGPNDANGQFSETCCKAKNGRVVENKQTGKKKCCLVKNSQHS